jgi:hypothetical protein
MLDRSMIVERLLAHSILFDEAARQHRNERVASELGRLAEDCLQAALAVISEMSSQSPSDADI